MATPQFHVSDDHKDALVQQFVTQALYALERMSADPAAPIADDYIDTFARCIAVMLAADTRITTPQKQRLGAETAAAHVLRHLKNFQAFQQEQGGTVLQEMMEASPIPDEVKRAWEN